VLLGDLGAEVAVELGRTTLESRCVARPIFSYSPACTPGRSSIYIHICCLCPQTNHSCIKVPFHPHNAKALTGEQYSPVAA